MLHPRCSGPERPRKICRIAPHARKALRLLLDCHMGSHGYSTRETLRDGTTIDVRAIRPDDKARLLEHFQSLGVGSAYFRFFSPKRKFSERELASFTELDFVHQAALVATVNEKGRERIVGLAQYVMSDEALSSADIACSVIDEYQGRGIGAALFEHLFRFARDHGVDRFEADVLGDNVKMFGLFKHSGLAAERSVESGVVHVTISGKNVDRVLAAA